MNKQARKVPPTARLAEFPEIAAEQALWWEGHILEVLHGLPPGVSDEAAPRPEFDPRQHSLAERERAKAAELTAAGHKVTASGIKQRRQRYQRDGLLGLADGRSAKQMPAFGKVDAAVVEAMRQAIGEAAENSSKTIGFIVWRAKEILAGREDAAGVEVPSRATLYRLYSKVATGTHAAGSARTRRSVNARPSGPFGELPASAPGELMQIDSTPLDVLVRLDDGIAEKVELTAMVDIATRSITAAVLRPTTKAADASALLARSVTPEAMRPGWSEALRMSRSVLPHRRLLSLDERLEHAAARPVIVPEDDRLRPRQGVRLPELPGLLPLSGHQPATGPQGDADRQGHDRDDSGLGGHAVRSVRRGLHRLDHGPPRPEAGGRAAVVSSRTPELAR
ncbi:hypothetical protein [Streptomyces sp. TR1341]|uniref:hypothetical protein n=1 Tax=Streptomyces sp. TR1341 TaxID=2601266 RepID=UPI003084236E